MPREVKMDQGAIDICCWWYVLITGVASHTKPGHLIELKYVPILKMYRALDKNDSFLIV